jgi:DNA-binding transcriptional LysR family regulator
MKQHGVPKTLYRGEEAVDVMTEPRFATNSVGLSRSLATLGVCIAGLSDELVREEVALGRLRRVLPEWSLAPVQVHALTETRLLPARTRLFIDFLKKGLQEASLALGQAPIGKAASRRRG